MKDYKKIEALREELKRKFGLDIGEFSKFEQSFDRNLAISAFECGELSKEVDLARRKFIGRYLNDSRRQR